MSQQAHEAIIIPELHMPYLVALKCGVLHIAADALRNGATAKEAAALIRNPELADVDYDKLFNEIFHTN